jgi:hypothetical protein
MKLGNWTLVDAHNRAKVLATLATVATLFCVCGSINAAEVYTWTDQNGVMHFSEVPPKTGSSELIDVEDAYRPGTTGAYPESEETDPALSADTADLFTESGDNIAQQRREQIASDRKTRQEEKAENAILCQKNQDLLARLEPARRVMYINEEGEETRMDDPARVGLIQETKDFVAKNCK